ncbi:hypothetical protein ACE3NQ_12710 [Paenibacillus terreus]|uniref:Uncharacterized protein n=1 Tax=Paenibacillus terreus TaxID=1387834 RepID=A0ABV5B897_9BACL
MSGYNYGADCSNGNCPDQMVTAPTQTQVQNIYKKQLVQVIHPIEIVKKYHCCPVYHHSYVYTVRDEIDSPQDLGGYPGGYGFSGQASVSSYRKKNLKKKSAAGRKAAVSRKAASGRKVSAGSKSSASRKASVSSARAKMKSKAVSKSGSKLGSKFASKPMRKR